MRSVKVPGRMVTKVISASPAASNSIESTPSGRISISLMTISFTQTLRKKSAPPTASSALPSASMTMLYCLPDSSS